ncbi:MAG: sugar ABC transporter permease [Clostridia bacterium]|nr:sugar ABC transporter permease [Clostridia bacterium]
MERQLRFNKKTGDRLFWLLLILPALIIITTFILIPIADSVRMSFTEYKMKNILRGTPATWNHFENYAKLLRNKQFLPTIGRTFGFVVGVVLAQFLLGMIFALILNSNVRGARLIRSVMMMPWVVPTVISALIWLWIFQSQYGLFKYLVSVFSLGAVNDFGILNDTSWALVGIGIAALWKQIPLTTLLLLAGLQNVPDDMIEAATIDGAGYFTRLFKIVMPYMRSVIQVVLTMAIIENFKQFPLIWTMTGGGPSNSTTTLAIMSYREAFVSQNLGSGAAVTTIWMLLMIVVVWVFRKLMKRQEID